MREGDSTLGERLRAAETAVRRHGAPARGRRDAARPAVAASPARRHACAAAELRRAGARSQGDRGGGAGLRRARARARARGRSRHDPAGCASSGSIPIVLVATGCLFALKIDRAGVRRRLHARRALGGSDTLIVTTVPACAGVAMRSPATPLETRPRAAGANVLDAGDVQLSRRHRLGRRETKPATKAEAPAADKARRPSRRSRRRATAGWTPVAARSADAARRRPSGPARTPAGAPPGARRARARARHAREPAQGGGEAARSAGRRAQGPGGADQRGGAAARTRPRPRASRTSSPCTRT